ncbi:MAG: hypothetical protein LBI04_08560 [Treponema sp.]|jgi:hypothetical protein|nr:hypothetical protein [Treponema sp.]
MNLLKLLLLSVVNGVTAEAELNTRRAADGRHPPFITSYTLPATHIEWPEGTLLVAGSATGSAKAAEPGDTDIIGVLDVRVGANEQSGNVIIHGSCPPDILKSVDNDELVDATAEQIKALKGIGVFV